MFGPAHWYGSIIFIELPEFRSCLSDPEQFQVYLTEAFISHSKTRGKEFSQNLLYSARKRGESKKKKEEEEEEKEKRIGLKMPRDYTVENKFR